MCHSAWYSVACPSCQQAIDVLSPQSIVADDLGVAQRCPSCRGWLASYVRQDGSAWQLEVRAIGSRPIADDPVLVLRRMLGC
jgi:hypothetical protein